MQPHRRAVDVQRHHHLLEGGIAGAFADPVHGHLDLPRARAQRRQGVGGGEAQVVLTVEGDHRLLELRNVPKQLANGIRQAVGQHVAHRVGDVDGARPGEEGHPHQLGHELRIGAGRVHRRELDVVAVAARASHRGLRHPEHLLATLAQLLGEVHVAAVDEDVDARLRGAPQRSARGVHVTRHGPGQAADRGVAHLAGHGFHRPGLGRRGGREAGLDHVHLHRGEPGGDLELVAHVEADAGGLLAVTQGGVEDEDLF